jgi:hypothetical protein
MTTPTAVACPSSDARRRQPARDLRRQLQGLAHRQRRGRQPLAQRRAVEQLEDEVGHAVLCADVVHRQDVRVLQRSERACLLLEAAHQIFVEARQHLDRHLAAEARIVRAVDLRHAALAERRADLVGAEPGALGERRRALGDLGQLGQQRIAGAAVHHPASSRDRRSLSRSNRLRSAVSSTPLSDITCAISRHDIF